MALCTATSKLAYLVVRWRRWAEAGIWEKEAGGPLLQIPEGKRKWC